MPAHVSKVTLFWRCLRTCCIYPSRTQIAQPSGHFLGQVAVQNRPQRRLQDILAALRVRVTDFGPQSPPRDPWGVRVRVPHFSSTNAIKCPSKGRVLNPLAPVSFFCWHFRNTWRQESPQMPKTRPQFDLTKMHAPIIWVQIGPPPFGTLLPVGLLPVPPALLAEEFGCSEVQVDPAQIGDQPWFI